MPFRKVSRGHQDLIEILYQVADRLRLRDLDYVIHIGTEDIDMYLNGTYKVDIKGTRDDQKVMFTAIIKWYADPQQRTTFRELFHREYTFFQYIVPEFLDIQRRFGIIQGLRMKFSNCIFASIAYDKEAIVVTTDRTFNKILDRFYKMDLDHAFLAMRKLAKLHALSFVLEKTKPNVFEELKDKCGKDVQYSDPTSMSKFTKCYYDASAGRPVDILLVDYQLWRLASPVTDLSYFFYMDCERNFLNQHYDRLINMYYLTLGAVLRQCNLEVEEIYPWSVFQKQLRQYSVLGLVEGLVSMKIITATTEDACKMTEMKYHTEDGLSDNVSQNYSLYVERVNGIVNDFFMRGYSLDELLENKEI
ncbi:ecdysteroid kinase domain-containing protein [Phthorimaea operculella]|nr:ecdysteroid kinase domain-containing protein [Phthorimaea operculella]